MMPCLNRRHLLVLAGAGLVAQSIPALAQSGPLRLAFIPQENPDKLLGDINAITTWLSSEIGVPVEGFVTIDHAAAVEALRNGDADISFMGALPFVLAEKEIGAVPLLSEVYRDTPSYTGRVFVRRDSSVKALADLQGRDIAFADPPYGKGLGLAALAAWGAAGWLKPGALLVLEEGAEVAFPAGMTLQSTRRYGDTWVHLGRWDG